MVDNKIRLLSVLVLSVLLVGAVLPSTAVFAKGGDDDKENGDNENTREQEEVEEDDQDEIQSSQVPEAVINAALGSFPNAAGVTASDLREAELEDGVYELEFEKAGQEFEVEVDSSTLAVLKTEIEDDEADEPLEVKEEEDSVDINSRDNSIEFSKDEPKVKFRVQTGTTELKFEAEFRSLIEFADINNSTKLDKGEDVFRLNLDSLEWNVTSTLSSDNSSVIITYRATTDEHDVEIEMTVPQSDGGDNVKAAIIVHKWAWQDESTTNLLALISEVRAQVEAEGVELPGDVLQVEGLTVAILAGEIAIQFTLETEIVIGSGSPIPVVSAYTTKLETETESEFEDGESKTEAKVKMDAVVVYPNFGNASMVHDPRIGFIDDPVQLGVIKEAIQRVVGTPFLNASTVIYAALGVTVVAVALFALRRKFTLNHAFPAALSPAILSRLASAGKSLHRSDFSTIYAIPS